MRYYSLELRQRESGNKSYAPANSFFMLVSFVASIATTVLSGHLQPVEESKELAVEELLVAGLVARLNLVLLGSVVETVA